MFRKPKPKNIRQRTTVAANDDEQENTAARAEADGDINEVNTENTLPSKPKSILSFDHDEGDDETQFTLKRESGKHSGKTAKKHRHLMKKQAEATVKEEAEEAKADDTDDIVIVGSVQKAAPAETPEKHDDSPPRPRFRKPEKPDISDENADDSDVRKKFSSTFSTIPDAKAVFEARKRRERMRNEGDFIPLDDTVRAKNRHGERSRLVREDDNDLSDEEEEGGRFYSSKSLLETEEERRRNDQLEALRIEQGDSDMEDGNQSDEDELARWEREQIRKGVSSQKVNQLHDELNATSLTYRGHGYDPKAPGNGTIGYATVEDVDMDVEIVEPAISRPSFLKADGTLAGGNVSLESVVDTLRLRLIAKQEHINADEASLERITSNLSENQTNIDKITEGEPKLQQKFQMFQEMRLYTRDLLECLNDKIDEVRAVEDDLMLMWKKRSERLIKRRRQDVQDQYERCAAISAGRQWTLPSAEYAMREAEREARRSRRRREREKTAPKAQHYEGLSSDDEETQSQQVVYQDTVVSSLEKASHIFADARDDFSRVDRVLDRFVDWLTVDPTSYEEAYIALCIPKLVSPFVLLELLDWNPLRTASKPLRIMDWYQQVLSIGLNNSNVNFEHPSVVGILPAIVEKVILPKITKIVTEQWDPLSLTESRNLSSVLLSLVEDFPSMSPVIKASAVALRCDKQESSLFCGRRHFCASLQQRVSRARAAVLYLILSFRAIENSETGCGAFLDRQFWKSIKLVRSLMSLRGLLSDAALEDLIVEGVINRCSVLALQFSVISDASMVAKCRAMVAEIPREWLPPSKPASYRSMAALLSEAASAHKHNNREFAREMQHFADEARRSRRLHQILALRNELNPEFYDVFDQKLEPTRLQIQSTIKAINALLQSQAAKSAQKSSAGSPNMFDDCFANEDQSTSPYEEQLLRQTQSQASQKAEEMRLRAEKARMDAEASQKLAQDVEDLEQIMSDLAQLVHSQHETVDSIEEHVERSVQHVKQGQTQLKKAVSSKNAKYPLIAAAVGGVAAGGPVGIFVGSAIAGVGAALLGAVGGLTAGRMLKKSHEEENKTD
ncbi:SNARE domain containing protein [Aphelenchoides avenae]|nr:SNARE domain containing protein [Aphelenchus avenae]